MSARKNFHGSVQLPSPLPGYRNLFIQVARFFLRYLKYTMQALPLRSIVSQSQAAPARAIEEIETAIMVLHAEGDRIFPLDYCRDIYDRLNCFKRFGLISRADHLVFAPPYLDRSLPPVADWFRETLG